MAFRKNTNSTVLTVGLLVLLGLTVSSASRTLLCSKETTGGYIKEDIAIGIGSGSSRGSGSGSGTGPGSGGGGGGIGLGQGGGRASSGRSSASGGGVGLGGGSGSGNAGKQGGSGGGGGVGSGSGGGGATIITTSPKHKPILVPNPSSWPYNSTRKSSWWGCSSCRESRHQWCDPPGSCPYALILKYVRLDNNLGCQD